MCIRDRKKRVEPLAKSVGSYISLNCDVTSDESMDEVFSKLKNEWGNLDFFVHAIAYSDKEELTGLYLDTSRDNFNRTMDISVYSFTALAKRAAEMMNDGGSMLTLTYYGSERVMPHYNVMGVAKAALEASVRYLAVDLGGRPRQKTHKKSTLTEKCHLNPAQHAPTTRYAPGTRSQAMVH